MRYLTICSPLFAMPLAFLLDSRWTFRNCSLTFVSIPVEVWERKGGLSGRINANGCEKPWTRRHRDGAGLYLLVKPTGAKSWLLRIQADGRRRDIGLGGVETSSKADSKPLPMPIEIPILHRKVLTLAEAREKARILRAAAKAGLDPIAERDRDPLSLSERKAPHTLPHASLRNRIC